MTKKKLTKPSERKRSVAIAKAVRTELLDLEKARELLRSTRDVDLIRDVRDAAKLKAEYHRIRDHGIGAVNDAQRVVVLAQARLGTLLLEAKDAGLLKKGRPKSDKKKAPAAGVLFLTDLGIGTQESSRCQRLAQLENEGELEPIMDSIAAKGRNITVKSTIAAVSDGEEYDGDEWCTPADRVELARRVLGTIDLDPTSNPDAQKTIRAKRYWTKDDDCRTRKWKGRVWLQPPYSHPLVEEVCDKFLAELAATRVTAAVSLVNNATDTAWLQRMMKAAAAVCFPEGRIAYVQRENGKAIRGTRQGQVFLYFGEDVQTFVSVFGSIGVVMVRA